MEQFDHPGDSTVLFAYQEFADSFPNSSWAREARNRIGVQTAAAELPADQQMLPDDSLPGRLTPGESGEGFIDPSQPGQEEGDFDIYAGLYTSPEGDSIIDLYNYVEISEDREPFIYPEEAYRFEFEGQIEMYFQIKLDSFGEVVDVVMKRPSPNRAINEEAIKNVRNLVFDVIRLEQDEQDKWWVYKYTVERPKDLQR